MLVAGEPSGDLLGAELVHALRAAVAARQARARDDAQPLRTQLPPVFFGAGGPRLAAAGAEVVCDLMPLAAIGPSDALRKLLPLRRAFHELLRAAIARQPDCFIGVDYSNFNRRLVAAIQRHVRARAGSFHNWAPRLVQYVSPQVWASRPGRVVQMERDYDLLVSILPFEPAWYARHAPRLRVEFVGHPIVERHRGGHGGGTAAAEGNEAAPGPAALPDVRTPFPPTVEQAGVRELPQPRAAQDNHSVPPLVALLPGSRAGEIARHWPVVRDAFQLVQARLPEARGVLVLPDETLLAQVRSLGLPDTVATSIGELPEALAQAAVAIASTGTVTLECALFGVPTVALYRTAWSTYQIARRIIAVRFLAMPNLLAGEAVMPEFIQHAATPANLARATLELLTDPARRAWVKERLKSVIVALGGPGASQRAAAAILRRLPK